ncbi:MAG: response regulator [Spirochaetales bacterium]|nr:response regulator [Spirochaetales bacterium]
MDSYIVLVDDEQSILNALRRELRNWAKERELQFFLANSGEAALAFLQEHYLDVTLLMSDQKMPGVKGHELLSTCAQRYPNIILMMLTGYTDINDIVKTIRAGVYSFILKPWDHDDLIYEVTKAYNIHEAREKNAAYLKRIKNEAALSRILESQLCPEESRSLGAHRFVSHIASSLGHDGASKDHHLCLAATGRPAVILSVCVEADPVRGTLIGATVALALQRVLLEDEATDQTPAILLARLCETMDEVSKVQPDLLIEMALAVFDPETRTLSYAERGYPPWVLVRSDGFAELASSKSASDEEQSIRLDVGDVVAIPGPGLREMLGATDADPRPSRSLARLVREYLERKSPEETCRVICSGPSGEEGNYRSDTDRSLSLLMVR